MTYLVCLVLYSNPLMTLTIIAIMKYIVNNVQPQKHASGASQKNPIYSPFHSRNEYINEYVFVPLEPRSTPCSLYPILISSFLTITAILAIFNLIVVFTKPLGPKVCSIISESMYEG